VTGGACPPWCVNDDCDGNHAGPTIEAGKGVSVTPGVEVSLLLTPYHEQANELAPEVFMTDDSSFSDWAVQLSVEEARRLGRALVDTADSIEPRSDGSD
jgi:hypothetical protein